jgi:tetratricopeptide (TPR) repeat protein
MVPPMAPFPHPAHRTGQADFPHPALGQDFTLSRATPSAASEHLLELLGFPISRSFTTYCVCRILQLQSNQVDPVHHVMPNMAYVDIAWAEGNVGLAQQHADRAFSIAIKSGNPYLRVYAQACRGFSHIIAGRFTSAIEDLSDALSFARSRKAGLENEPRILADLANAYRLNGESVVALSTVDQAIKVATERHARIPECLARIIRADLLMRFTTSDQKGKEGTS